MEVSKNKTGFKKSTFHGRAVAMVGRIMSRARNLWIMIISMLVFLAVIILVWVLTSQSKTEIPKKGVFVYADIKTGVSPQ